MIYCGPLGNNPVLPGRVDIFPFEAVPGAARRLWLALTPVALRAPYVSASHNKTNKTEGTANAHTKMSRSPEAKKEKAKNLRKTID